MKKINSVTMLEQMGIKSQSKEGLILHYSKLKLQSVLNNLKAKVETTNLKNDTITILCNVVIKASKHKELLL